MANMTPQELPELPNRWRRLADHASSDCASGQGTPELRAALRAEATALRRAATELEAALAGAGAVAEVVETRCGCHPETCCCGEYTLKINGSYAACGTKARMDRIADAVNVTHPAPVAGVDEAMVNRIVRDVAELPDRNSPEDWPEAMLVTANELGQIITAALGAKK